MADTLRMVRDGLSADVHVDEVRNYSDFGWALAEDQATPEPESVSLFDVFKVKDGEQSKRASKVDMTMEAAEAYVAERPDNEYVIVEASN